MPETEKKTLSKYTKTAIVKTVIIVIAILLNILVSALIFFAFPISAGVLSALLLFNVSSLSLYRNTTPIDAFINKYMTDSSTISVKLEQIGEFLEDARSVRSQIESAQVTARTDDSIAREPTASASASTAPPTPTPRFTTHYIKDTNTLEISIDSPRSTG